LFKATLKIFFTLLLILNFAQAHAMPDEAKDWVMRMLQAGQSLNYKGNMIGVRGSNVELMGIVHKIDASGEKERIFSLNGVPREIIRKSGQLICYLPDQGMGLQGKLFKEQRFFPAFSDSEVSRLDDYYDFELESTDRIANREAQVIKIEPRDKFRYGYKLWIDKDTGLLLQSASVDEKGAPLERYMFTDVQINIPISESDLEPSEQAKVGLSWIQTQAPESPDDAEMPCKLDDVPNGYELVHSMIKPATDKQKMMSQYVFSDGLANFSLFIESAENTDEMKMDGAYQLGVVNVYSRIMDGNRVTMMGEVPPVTAKAVAMAVSECQ